MKAKEFITENLRDPKDNPCWKGYKPVGTKKKNGKTVPNCVPKESIEENRVDSPVSNAIIQRIASQRRDLISKFGPATVMTAVDVVADWYDDVEEIGTSDVSNWVSQVDRYLRTQAGEGLGEADYNAEYDDEAGMADNNLETLERAVQGIDDLIDAGDNLPEWCQEKIAVAKSMLVAVWDYMRSEEETNEDWQKVNKKDKTDGMSKKAVKAYRRENPGSKLKTAVTKKPSEIKKGSSDDKRRKSFCARMSGNPGPMKDEKGRPTPKAKALSRWNCR